MKVLLMTALASLVASATGGPGQSRSFPRYDRALLLDSTPDTSANVSIADINRDGNLDLVLIKGRHWPGRSRVLLGDGKGHFQNRYNLADAAYRSYSGHLADLDVDGDLDVVLSNDQPDPKLIYFNDGQGHFQPAGTYGRPEWETRNATVVDLNRDSQPDIVVANRSNKAAQFICLNQGKGRFDAGCIDFSHASATTITAADFNKDGLIDLAVPHRDGGQSYVHLNPGNNNWTTAKRIPFGPPNATIRMTEAADLNRDGLLDLVAIDDEKKAVAIYFGQKDGTFSTAVALDDGGAVPYALLVTDLDRDGNPDIIVGNVEAPSRAFFNDGSGNRYGKVVFGDSQGAVYGFAVADLDEDGVLDIAAARSDAPSVVYFGSR